MNWDSVRAILAAVAVPCELGGGIRDEPRSSACWTWASRGWSSAPGRCASPIGFAPLAAASRPAGAGHRRPRRPVATDGWLETSSVAAEDLARQFDSTESEPAAIIYTDIATDGMLAGPNLAAMRRMRDAVKLPLVASGGVTTADDVASGRRAGRRLHHRPRTVRRNFDACRRLGQRLNKRMKDEG